MKPDAANADRDEGFLPDFCNGWTVFNIAVLAELLAIVVTLFSRPISTSAAKDLFLVSLFVQWIAMASAAALCVTRKYLNRLPPVRTVAMAYLLLLCIAWLVGELMIWLMWAVGMIGSPRPDWYIYFHVQNLTVAAIVDALALRYFFARHQLKQSVLAEARARAEILKYRIRPHFLFNSMNIIASLARRAPAKAEAAIEDMADVFRLMLDETKHLVPVVSEIEVAKKYLALEKLRLDKRLNVSWDIGTIPRTAKMPVLMLQLLLENAIYFGIEPSAEPGEITLELRVERDMLYLRVSNPMPEGTDPGCAERDSPTVENIRQRLSNHYGAAAVFDVEERPERFTIDVKFPAFGGAE